jgi:O-antigen/teichoic acid export membrane protein
VNTFLLTTPFTILLSNFESVFKTFKRFRLSTSISIIANVISLIVLVTLATQGVTAVIWGYVAVTLIRFGLFSGVAIWLLRTNLSGAHGHDYRQTWRRLMPFVFHTSLMGSLKSITINIDTLLLGALAGSSAVGYYNIARSAVNLIALPVTPVATVIYPLMNEAWAVDNLARVKYLIRRYMLLSAVICIGIALGFVVLADLMVTLVYGADFLPTANLIRIMSIGVVLESVMGWVRTAALSSGKPQLVTFTGVTASLIFIPLDFLLIVYLGATGSAIGYIIAVIMMVLLNTYFVLPKIGLSDIFFGARRKTV